MAMHDLVESLASSELFEFIKMEFEVWMYYRLDL